jgi:hypothetical protein
VGELKHLSTPRKREHSPSSGERSGEEPKPGSLSGEPAYAVLGLNDHAAVTVLAAHRRPDASSRTDLERPAKAGESPVGERRVAVAWHVSTAGHVQPRRKLGSPLSKAKYSHRPIANEYREGKVKSTPGGE